MFSNYFVRIRIGILFLIILLAIYGSRRLLLDSLTRMQKAAYGDSITLYILRFERLKNALQEDEIVGYLTDSASGTNQDYLLTQYALAPVIVKKTPKEDRVVGNFYDYRNLIYLLRQENLSLLKDYGKGVLLLGRKRD